MTVVESKKFKIGDKVIAICDTPSIAEGWIGYVVSNTLFGDYEICAEGETGPEAFYENELELLSVSRSSIARPILEERKIGKIRMELFDTGFPNAVLEIARMMTWANEYKGYKDNDWKVLPDAENAFKGAAARHRVKLDAQRSFGEDLLNCVDEESNITHLAHECFNNLALLELVLVGRIK